MILHYFTKKENNDKKIAQEFYKKILYQSNNLLKKNKFFKKSDFNSSFEIVSIFLIFYIKLHIQFKTTNYKKINEYLIETFVLDLDDSLRSKGIGDMSIGKYVKSYVKKFYFRISKFPHDNNLYKNNDFIEYLKLTDLIKNDNYVYVSRIFNDKFSNFINTSN